MRDPLTAELSIQELPDLRVPVARLDGTESIGALFSFELLLAHTHLDLDPGELIEKEATLAFLRDGVEERRLFGLIVSVRDRMDGAGGHATLSVVFVPRAYRLVLHETLDVVLDASVPDILRKKLEDLGLNEGKAAGQPRKEGIPHDFDLRLMHDYPARELVVQYKESDLAFVSRLCEHIGISFFFVHRHGRDVMVFTDQNGGFAPQEAALPYMPRGEHTGVFKLEEVTRVVPSSYVVRDYNYRTPQLSLTGTANLSTGSGSVVEYGAHVKTPEEAEHMARIRAEERLVAHRQLECESDLPGLFAGAAVRLEGHPRGDLDLLITEVVHRGAFAVDGASAGEGYRNTFRAILQSRTFRPARKTPKPRIHGVVTGIIDASDKGTYAKIDDQGRYLVRFVFDTHTPHEQQASRWVRMAQPHAGPGYGLHFPLRPGVEVIVTFLDGDPDRPIIAATVPNPQTASPVTSGNAERNIIRTGGGNEVNLDDTKDSERIKLSTPFMSTTLQLGTKNSPEDGVMIETKGHQSTMAMSSANSFTSLNSSINAIKNFALSGKITTVADFGAEAIIMGGISTVTQVMGASLDMASAVLDAMEADLKEDEVKKKKESILKQKAAQDAEKKRKDARQKTKDKLAALEACYDTSALSDPNSELAKKKKAYDDAVAQYEADVLEWRTVREWLTEANRGIHLDKASDASDPNFTQYTINSSAQKEYNEVALKELERKIKDEDEPAIAAARAAYLAELAKCTPKPNTDPAAALTAFNGAVTAQGTINTADSEEAKAHKAWLDADKAKDDWYTQAGLNETGADMVEIKKHKTNVQIAKTTQGLFSNVMNIVALILELKDKLKQSKHKVGTIASALATQRREDPTTILSEKHHWVTHTLGSSGNTVLYADKELLTHADKAILHGKTGVLVVSDALLSLLSKDKAELAALNKVLVTGADVDVLGSTSVKVSAVEKVGVAPAAVYNDRAVLDLQQAIASLKVDDAANTTRAQLDLEAAGKATITVGDYLVIVDENQGISIGQKQGAALDPQKPHVKIEGDKITVCRKQGAEQIRIEDKLIMIQNAQAAGLEVDNKTTRMWGGSAEVVADDDGVYLYSGKVEITAKQQNVTVSGKKVLLG
jgi:type VI secretion system secreted protein VgrG